MAREISRRSLLQLSGATGGVLLSSAARRWPALAQTFADIDIGLVAPASGSTPHTLTRVLDALSLHEKDKETKKSIYPEFDGKIVEVLSMDSAHSPELAIQHVDRLVRVDKVQWIVSGDVHSSVTEQTEKRSKALQTDCIIACDRMKLKESNPHPYAFQLLPDYNAWFTKIFAANSTPREAMSSCWQA